MKDLKGKVAFITGGTTGIGFALAQALGEAGMKVMIASNNQKNLDEALARLRGLQIAAEGVKCDVANRGDIQNAALATIAKFGKVHLLINNAGVAVGGALADMGQKDWQWILGTNVMGVINGTEVFAPLLESHGEGGHIVNTASVSGFLSLPGSEPYAASKFAVVALSEGWRLQLAPRGIGVSIIAPGFVRTNFSDSQRNRPQSDRKSANPQREQMMRAFVEGGMEPSMLAARVIEAIKDDELYVFTHPELKPMLKARFDAILAAHDVSAKSPALANHKPQDLGAIGGPASARK